VRLVWQSPRIRAAIWPAIALLFIGVGALLHVTRVPPHWARDVWIGGLVLTGGPIVWRTARAALAGRFSVDLVAAFSIGGALMLGQPLAGLVIVLMQSGGEALERYAAGRASAAVRALEEAAPRQAHRITEHGIDEVPAEAVAVGDTLLVRPGDLVPCNAVVVEGRSHVDASRLTGESLPVSAAPGTSLLSGSVNGEGPLTVRATAVARESQYARIVELVRSAQQSKAPLQRLADRYAVWFTPITVGLCIVVYLITRDPIRVLAVLVVATPCPLILAAPVAIIGGINRAARRRVIVRNGDALERLAAVTVAVFDKTGTLTIGRPRVRRVIAAAGFDETFVLRQAAAVEHGSGHLLARTVVEAAEQGGLALPVARDVVEVAGQGVSGSVNGHSLVIGSRAFVETKHVGSADGFATLEPEDAALRAYVSVDGRPAGVIEFADAVRPALAAMIADLASLDVRRTVLLSGDQERYAQAVARDAGIAEGFGDLLPGDKVGMIRKIERTGAVVMMVGDGTNDAPALAAADVGVAMAGHGGGIAAEAAGVVLLSDDLSGVADSIRIARRTLRIARESIWAGLGLSGAAMLIAAAGLIPPTIGAVLQELIDVAVILNAVRASQ
jgi:heavy metal translocating P-type ATPase